MALNQFSGKQVKNSTLRDQHVAADAAINETKLNIAWDTHYHAALAVKLLVDYVQLNGIPVLAGESHVVIGHGNGAGKIALGFANTATDYGVANSYSVLIRNSATGEPVIVNNKEVFGVISFDGAQDEYTIAFNTGNMATPVAVNLPAGVSDIDIQYMARFNLDTINESFASNEKFVDGTANVSEVANFFQLAKDIFLPGYVYDNDGNPNLAKPVMQVLSEETHGIVNNLVDAKTIIDEVITGRGSFNNLKDRFDADEARIVVIENWKDTNNTQLHTHLDEVGVTVVGNHYDIAVGGTLAGKVKSTDFIEVYLNGARQYPGTNFVRAQDVDGILTGIEFQGSLEDGWDVYIVAAVCNS